MIHEDLRPFIDHCGHFMEKLEAFAAPLDRVFTWYWGKIDQWARPWHTLAFWMPEIVLVLLALIFLDWIIALEAVCIAWVGVPRVIAFGIAVSWISGGSAFSLVLWYLYQKQRGERCICTRCGMPTDLACTDCEEHACLRCFEQAHVRTPEALALFRQSLNEVIRQSEESEQNI